ncbi:MAG TPA: thioredoxin [Ilumatobacteraceae bacterium]|nr:thioredoxin [Ilumatobacteraceae bacterium]
MADTLARPELPDGIVVVVKEECATCHAVGSVLVQLDGATTLTVYTQDDPNFPGDVPSVHDADLALSWHHAIETVPTVIRVVDGVEIERTVGWHRDDWERVTGITGLGPDLPAMRPGCGSMSVDPDLVDALNVRFGASVLASRRIDVAAAEDEMELMFTRGWTDGLPVVPPTEERVMRMLMGTLRAPSDIVATVPPDLVDVTVEKVAIAAVMAGCKPEYLPWVLTAVEAACTNEFNMHGLLATTMPVGPVIVCSGPGTRAIGMNSGGNALGQGNRANSTIGRALQLVVRNVGGGRPGEVDRATHGSPGKIGFCFAENDADSPYGRLAGEHGIEPGVDALTLFAGEGTRCVVDQLSRDPESLARSLAASLQTLHHPKLILGFDAILVMGPEHARVFAEGGWDREQIVAGISAHLNRPGSDLVRGADGMAEGLPAGFADAPSLPKFRPGGLMLAYAGGGAGLFSEIIGGWANGEVGSAPVTRAVTY